MSEDSMEKTANKEQQTSWGEFLGMKPPGKAFQIDVSDILKNGANYYVCAKTLRLFCESDHCAKTCFFDSESPVVYLKPGEAKNSFINYYCRHCKETERTFAVMVYWNVDNDLKQSLVAVKLGEWPPYGYES